MKNIEKNRKLLERPKVASWVGIFSTYRMVFSHLGQTLNKMDCSISRFQILLNLYFNGATTPIALSRKLDVSRANITTFLRRMIGDGLIETTTSDGGTEKRPAYRLSRKGISTFEKLLPQHIAEVENIMPVFSQEMLDSLTEIREKIAVKNK
ncbi:MAG: MarR family transcriptional regulator [Halobacteriovoraceae bacterium]|nr:MarR family transcriptional regulator [Halobacteriovoraceae bacterium]